MGALLNQRQQGVMLMQALTDRSGSLGRYARPQYPGPPPISPHPPLDCTTLFWSSGVVLTAKLRSYGVS